MFAFCCASLALSACFKALGLVFLRLGRLTGGFFGGFLLLALRFHLFLGKGRGDCGISLAGDGGLRRNRHGARRRRGGLRNGRLSLCGEGGESKNAGR